MDHNVCFLEEKADVPINDSFTSEYKIRKV